MQRSRRTIVMVLGGVAGALLVVVLAGHSLAGAGTVCPAIGWINSVPVEVTGVASEVSTIEVCGEDGRCTQPPGVSDPTDSEGRIFYAATKVDDRRWNVTTDMSSPSSVLVTVRDASGATLARQAFDLN